ncbi:MAG: hypothetical protein J6R80_03700 [Kiritimatiellae bacterium]|nr:hypothetical protein [Kiritimatiellia bacterium]
MKARNYALVLMAAFFVSVVGYGADVYYVNPQTYAAILENAKSGDIVYAAAGDYTQSTYVDAKGVGHVVNIPSGVSFIAQEGSTKTFITGGENLRGANLASGAMLRGFTVRNGKINPGYGGGISAPTTVDQEAFIVDCYLTGNTAERGGDGNGGTYFRCRFSGSKATGGVSQAVNNPTGVWGSIFENHSNYSLYTGPSNIKVVNCTFAQSSSGPRYPANGSNAPAGFEVYNSIILGENHIGCNNYSSLFAGSIVEKSYDLGGNKTNLSKMFLDANLRPIFISPAVDAADEAAYTLPEALVALIGEEDASLDICGFPRKAGNGLDIGAVESLAYEAPFAIIDAKNGGLALEGVTNGVNVAKEGSTLSFSITAQASDPQCIGFKINETNVVLFSDYPLKHVWTWEIADPSEAIYLEAIYDVGRWFYVDPAGSDGNDGKYPGGVGHAFKTLSYALSKARSGDTVWAAPGYYDEGSQKHDASAILESRAVIPEGVKLYSLGTAENTFIMGRDASGVCIDNNVYKTGTNGLRCVYMNKGSRLRGFTLTGGRAGGLSSYAGLDKHYAGLNAKDNTCTVEHCIISNNVAYGYSGACVATFAHCKFLSNRNIGDVACVAQHYGRAYNCLYDGNIGGRATMYVDKMLNCTIGPNNASTTGSAVDPLWGVNSKDYFYVNLLVRAKATGNIGAIYNCILSADRTPEDKRSSSHYQTNSVWVTDAEMAMAADHVSPTAESTVIHNAGDAAKFEEMLNLYFPNVEDRYVDLAGNPRISNGGIDAGCFEFDFKPIYSQSLNSLGAVNVISASSSVTKAPASGVTIPNSGEIVASVKLPNGETQSSIYVEVSVDGEGALKIYQEGADEPSCRVVAADGLTNVVVNVSNMDVLRFAFSGEGSACVSRVITAVSAVILSPDGGLIVEGAEVGTNYVSLAEDLSFTLKRGWDSSSLLTGVYINGVYHDFENYPDGITINLSGADPSSSCEIISSYAKRPYTWYVDAANGSDENTGFHPSNAFKRLIMASTNSALKAGDTIKLLPGRYDEGYYRRSADDRTLTRGFVPNGVTLTSTHGKEQTVIAGALPKEYEIHNGWEIGEDGVRCLVVESGAILRDLTIEGGRAAVLGIMPDDPGDYAGGIYVITYDENNLALAEDLIITNCRARIGGGTSGGGIVYNRCKVIDCHAHYYAGGVNDGHMFNSVVDYCNSYAAHNLRIALNCTFGPNNTTDDTRCGGAGMPVFNSLVLGKAGQGCIFHRCLFPKMIPPQSELALTPPKSTTTVVRADCILPGAGVTGAVDANYSPVFGQNSGIDKADITAFTTNCQMFAKYVGEGFLDFLKGQRIYNNALDIGAIECDRRPDYARMIGARMTVKYASPNVVDASNTVRLLGDGAALLLEWSFNNGGRAAMCEVNISLAGSGTCYIYNEGAAEPLAQLTGEGTKSVAFECESGTHTMRFEFEGEGYADILGLKKHVGAILTVR